MTSSDLMLNLDQSPEALDDVWRTHYYWYLHSESFRKAFLAPLGKIVNRLGRPCLDVGCGEGWLADYLTVPYVGFDGSALAIGCVRKRHPDKLFHYGRVERPELGIIPPRSTIVFGNLLAVTVREEAWVDFLEMYRKQFNAAFLIVYDLEQVDTSAIERRLQLIDSHRASVEMPEIETVKRHRKILVFSC